MAGGPPSTQRLPLVLRTLQQTLHLLLLLQLLLLPAQVLLPLEVRAAVFASSSSNSSSSSDLTLPVRPCCLLRRPVRTIRQAADTAAAVAAFCVFSSSSSPLPEVSQRRAFSPGGQLRPLAAAAAAAAAGDDGHAGGSSSDSSSTNTSSGSSVSHAWGLAGLLATQHAALSGAAAAAAAAATAAGGGRGGRELLGEEEGGFCSSLPSLPLPQRGLGKLRVCGGRLARRRLLMPRTDVTRPMMERVRPCCAAANAAAAADAAAADAAAVDAAVGVRAALFSMLHSLGVFSLPGLRVLDLFCGSGALAIESLSRGAQHATLAAAVNLRHLGCTDSRVLRLCVFELLLAPQRFLARDSSSIDSSSSSSLHESPPFDLVFVCPPYTEVIYGDLLEASFAAAVSAVAACTAASSCHEKLLFSGLLKPGSLVVVEFPRELGCLPLKIGFPGAPLQLEGLKNRRYGRTCVALYAAQASREGGTQLHCLLPADSKLAEDKEGEAAAARDAQQDEPRATTVSYLGAPHEFDPPKQHRRARIKTQQQQQQQQEQQ
ncbi:hypothetical protein Emed_007441 [Eimeria media]